MSETTRDLPWLSSANRFRRVFSDILDFFTARRVEVSGPSMLPQFPPGTRLVVSQRSLAVRPVERFDVVLVASTDSRERVDLKRVVGLPGESVEIRDGGVRVDGKPLAETHASATEVSPAKQAAWRLGAAEYFVLGDNRAASTDSRGYGPVPQSRILGRVVRRF